MEMIGRGEKAALEILKELFGDFSEYYIQYPLTQMVTDEYFELFTGRQIKETVDIVVFTYITKPLVVRIQDKHHSSIRMSRIDDIQRQLLEENGWIVIDVWYYECKELWKDRINDKSRKELIKVLKTEGVDNGT